MSRDGVRARVQAEVASLQKKKNEVRARIMSEVVTLQSERRKQNDNNQVLQAKIKEKLASKAVDRAKVLEDVVKLKQERGIQRRVSDSSLLQSRASDRSLPQRGGSFSEKSLQIDEPSKDISRNRRESYSRSGSEMLESGGPTILIPDSSTHSEGRHSVGQSTSDRFQRLLHKQIQNQLFKSTARNGDPLKSESERDSKGPRSTSDRGDLTSSNHDSVLASKSTYSVETGSARSGVPRTLPKGQEDSTRSSTGDTSTQSPNLRTFIANDDSRWKPSSDGSSMSLPGARPTPVNGDSQLDDSPRGSDRSLHLSDISRASPTISSSTKSTLSPSVKTSLTSSPSKKSTLSPSKILNFSSRKKSATSATKKQGSLPFESDNG
jgi:hypothetical protein